MNIFFFARTVKPEHIEQVTKLFLRIQSQCEQVFILSELHDILCKHPQYDRKAIIITDECVKDQHIDYCIAIGGDGSFLHAANSVVKCNIPLVGINMGRLGFLTDVSIHEADQIVGRLRQKEFRVEERSLLHVAGNDEGFGGKCFAINEVTLSKKDITTLISIEMYINDKYALTYWADGVIVSTPTGSTAYNLSCGGPIIFPSAECIVITPYASHNLNIRPIVLPSNVKVKFKVACRTSNQFICTLDYLRKELSVNTEIFITRSPHKVRIIKINEYDFIDALTEKLHLGLDVRNL